MGDRLLAASAVVLVAVMSAWSMCGCATEPAQEVAASEPFEPYGFDYTPLPWAPEDLPVSVGSVDCPDELAWAVQFWHDRGVDAVVLADAVDADVVVEVGPVLDDAHFAETTGHFEGGKTVAAEVVTTECWGRILAHEIGHVLGIGHDHDPHNIMHDWVDWDSDQVTAKQVGEIHD